MFTEAEIGLWALDKLNIHFLLPDNSVAEI